MNNNYKYRKEKELNLLSDYINKRNINSKMDFNKFYKIKQIDKKLLPLTKKGKY